MKMELNLAEEFGPRLADGEQAAEFRLGRIDPYVGICDEMVLDFTGIRNANSSFINALLAGAIEQHGEGILQRMVFKGCNPVVKVLVESAISLGLDKVSNREVA
ncbi:MAG: STAS-like domain-containing protein [Prosthecobacter sp.]|nr:STAS-like domain-containing protein [Prosthecobacter sp.]